MEKNACVWGVCGGVRGPGAVGGAGWPRGGGGAAGRSYAEAAAEYPDEEFHRVMAGLRREEEEVPGPPPRRPGRGSLRAGPDGF